MSKERIPIQLLFGQLNLGQWHQGGLKMRFKDALKRNLKANGLDYLQFERLDRTQWRYLWHSSLKYFEDNRIKNLEQKHKRRKECVIPTGDSFTCPSCKKKCRSKTGLVSHQRHAGH